MAVISAGTALAIGAGTAAVGTAVGVAGANKQRRAAQRNKSKAEREIASIKASRQTVINPYENVKDLSGLASDTSASLSNPFASLGVATSAAEIQIEEADIALANTLDTLRATGASAGGATALAQAALQSKKGVAASIEQQEAANEKARAQGEQGLQQLKMSEQQRLQGIAISEGQRVQSSEAAGKQFQFGITEERTNADLDRAAGQERQAQQAIADANAAKSSAIAGGFSALGSMAGSIVGAGGIK
tara:strand:- start:5436 stop:6176 length:741 start_codon:yes stop_codon:yes gene_type:complete